MSRQSPFLLLMPSYNQARYVADAVRSVLAQDDPDWELWVVDNSVDETPRIMRDFADSRIHFHHIAERMDPGSCLNWMLERAVGQHFSYIHTDNNLYTSYVSRMRSALSGRPLGLAYCDMSVIDGEGKHLRVFRRGEFDLPRMLSVDTLGVPFAATTELARQMGGFSVADSADDVAFCVGAYGLAEYVYLSEPLLDYRLHGGSRTEKAGGDSAMQLTFVSLMPRIVSLLEARGLRPIEAMDRSIKDAFEEVDALIEDRWYRDLSKLVSPWWHGRPRIEHFLYTRLLDVPGFSSKHIRPPQVHFIRDDARRICAFPWQIRTLRHHLRQHNEALSRPLLRLQKLLPVWAPLKLHVSNVQKLVFRIRSADFRTMWIARQLEILLDWQPLWDLTVPRPPTWLHWGKASGNEPLLDLSTDINPTKQADGLVRQASTDLRSRRGYNLIGRMSDASRRDEACSSHGSRTEAGHD